MDRIPYARLRAAERDAQQQHPHATRTVAIWSPGSEHDVLVEVWFGNRASVVPA